MSRQRDYQPTIERAAGQAERAARQISRLQEKADGHHREMLRAQAAARIAGEEADALRDRIVGLENSNRDLRSENKRLRADRDGVQRIVSAMRQDLEGAKHPWRAAWQRLCAWVRDMMRIGAEA